MHIFHEGFIFFRSLNYLYRTNQKQTQCIILTYFIFPSIVKYIKHK